MSSSEHIQPAARAPDEPVGHEATPRAQRARIEAAFLRRRRSFWVLPLLVLVWLLAAAYYVLTPPVYVSKWTLIVPTASNGSSVTLDTIGQASSVPNQTFGSISLSPKVIYREIADSEQVRREASRSLGLALVKYGRARVKLIDETSLMLFQMSGPSPEEAQAKSRALQSAFARQLDTLRRDELERRALIVRENLTHYQSSLNTARERILELQRTSGLLSLNQFNEAVSSAEIIRRKLAEHRADLRKIDTEQALLVERVGIAPAAAAAGLKLAADPAFAKIAAAFAEANSALHENRQRYGPNHPAAAINQTRLDGALAEIDRLARTGAIDPSIDLPKLVLMMNGSHQSELFRAIVANEAMAGGRRSEVGALEAEFRRLETEIGRMSGDAARLEHLKKDHLVAEAVFTSAVARLDTGRGDLYSSYPMVQVLAEPDLPIERTQPQLLLAIAAGIAGTLLVLVAWGVAWLRRVFGPRRRKSA